MLIRHFGDLVWQAAERRLFSYLKLEQRVRPGRPSRVIRGIVNVALVEMSAGFASPYPPTATT